MAVKIEFTKDFANRKKGETWSCDGMLASQLVRVDKVAKFKEEEKPKAKPKAKKK